MLGKPKFKEQDLVAFTCNGESKIGKVFVVDRFGTFFDRSDVSYDIKVEEENTLYKHVTESLVKKAKEEL